MSDESVTGWIDDLRAGDSVAAQKIVDRYFARVAQMVRRKLPSNVRRAADEEDVALSALGSVVGGIQQGKFDELGCRDELWRLLVTISQRKAASHIVRETALKRGGGNVRGESAFQPAPGESEQEGLDRIASESRAHAEEIELKEYADRIVQFLEGLPDPTLRDIALWKSLERTDAWIAEQLNCSTKTVERKRQLIRQKVLLWAETSESSAPQKTSLSDIIPKPPVLPDPIDP